MKLTTKERRQLKKLLSDERRPGMIIWMEPHEDGDTYSTGFAQGDPFDMMAMAIHAVDFFANAYGLTPEVAAKGLADFFANDDYKPSNIKGELYVFPQEGKQ